MNRRSEADPRKNHGKTIHDVGAHAHRDGSCATLTVHYESIESESLEEARESRHGTLSHATLRCGILTTRARIRWCQETLEMLRDQQTDAVVGV
jgi:hypothetical protein